MRLQGNLLFVRDLAESERFYVNGLGLQVVARPAPHLAIVSIGDAQIFLHQDPADAPDWMKQALSAKVRGVGVLPHIQVADVAAVKEQLKSNGFQTSLGPVEEHGSMRLYAYDPSGYNLVFVQPLGQT